MKKAALLSNFKKLGCNYTLLVRNDLCNGNFLSLMQNIDKASFQWQSNSKSAKFARFEIEGKGYYIKRFYNRNSLEMIKSIFKGSRAYREFYGNQLLQKQGINSPKAAAIIENKRESFIVTDEIKSKGSFLSFVIDSRNPLKKRREAAKKLATDLAKLHKNKIILGDINMNNALVGEDKGEIEIYILDNERTQKSIFPKKGRIKNLVQLNKNKEAQISLTDRLRFYQYYCEGYGKYSVEKSFIKILINKTDLRRAKSNSLNNTYI